MRTWILKEPDNIWPFDMICVQINETTLLFIHSDGGCDFEPVEHGKPSASHWWEFEL